MQIRVPGNPNTAQSADPTLGQIEPESARSDSGGTIASRDQPMTSQIDPTGYYKWLSMELRRVHDAV